MKLRYNFGTFCALYLIICWATALGARESPDIAEIPINSHRRPTPEAYNAMRDTFFRYEESKFFGANTELTEKELAANQIIMDAKIKEYKEGLATPHLFAPSQYFSSVLEEIRKSPLFKILAQMPKGGVLHAHQSALCSTEFIVKLTYRDKLWAHHCNGITEVDDLIFSLSQPIATQVKQNCSWDLLSKLRDEYGAKNVDEYLTQHLTLYPTEKFLDNNVAWRKFNSIFGLLNGLLSYAPVFANYYYQALEEFQADGVQYLEFRTTLPKLYDLEGKQTYMVLDTVRVYVETLNNFKAVNPGFIGSKMIYAPVRVTDENGIKEYIRICLAIKEKYPNFVAGFDLVGQEEMGNPLKYFLPELLSMPDNIDFFFHAGETNWFGSTVDENLIDAVLLGAKRIGHGFALVKHPAVLQLLKERNIAVEVNPISNQVLQLVTDFRNHPCAHLFADNYPVVISSDDPSFWKATPLSHDFYVAFLGIASAHSDMRLLKKLAINSIAYSSLTKHEKAEAVKKWQIKWDQFIANMVDGESNAALERLTTNKINCVARLLVTIIAIGLARRFI